MKPLYLLALWAALANCNKGAAGNNAPLFDSIPVAHVLSPLVNEISGIADSKRNPGYLWAHEDSGNPTQLYLVKHDGTVAKRIFLKNTLNRDWEDMALLGTDLLIADIGDNNQVQTEYRFYRLAEPAATVDTVFDLQQIRFQYPDGPHDAEAFIADPLTNHIYIITKRDQQAGIYRLSFPYSTMNTLTLVGTLPYTGVVSAAISGDGKEILVKTYSTVYYYARSNAQPVEQVLRTAAKQLGYQPEPQGEAIAFANDRSGFFTLSEKAYSNAVHLNFYKRK